MFPVRRTLHVILLTAILSSGCRPASDPDGTDNVNSEANEPADANQIEDEPNAPTDGDPAERLRASDFVYEGAFRLPPEFNYGARGVAFRPGSEGEAGTLLVTGFELPMDAAHPGEACWDPTWNCRAWYAEVTIPVPVQAEWASLPEATVIGSRTAFDDGRAASVHREYIYIDDLAFVPRRGSQTQDKLYGSLSLWYAEGVAGESTFPTVWLANLDGTQAHGPFAVGPDAAPYHGRKMGAYLFAVPTWYADAYLGGRTLVTGRARGTPQDGAEAVTIRGGSQGPTLFAFRAAETDAPTGNWDALPVLYYRVSFPACAGPNVGAASACDYPGFTMCDDWSGGAFVDDGARRAILLVGLKGLGPNCYDEPPVDCDDPCSDAHGYHCQPYERQIIFYDVRALGQSAQGEHDPWRVVPYEIWRPTEFYLRPTACWNAGGMAWDEAGRRLYVVERGLGTGEENACVVHVWSL